MPLNITPWDTEPDTVERSLERIAEALDPVLNGAPIDVATDALVSIAKSLARIADKIDPDGVER